MYNEIPLYFDYSPRNVFIVDPRIDGENSTYTITDRIGNGGNAVVCKCVNSDEEEFAIKFFLKPDQNKRQRFQLERDILKKIKHSHIVKLIDEGKVPVKGQIKEAPFMVMELADANLLEFRKNHEIPFSDYIEQFKGLSSALAELHSYGIHRDIKPDNILIFGNRWVLSDLGLFRYNDVDMKLTNTGETVNPKFWLSPEGINSFYAEDIVNKSSDVFQLGCIFWYVINGKYPLGIVNKDDWKAKNQEFLYDFVYRTLMHNGSKRIQNGTEMYNNLIALIQE